MALPNPGMDFNPFDTLPAASLDDLVENIEALAAGTGLNTSAIVTAKLADDSVTAAKLIYGVVRNRQGSTTGDASWATSGNNNTDTSSKDVFIQVGSVASSTGGAVGVTFPIAFAQAPIVMLTAERNAGVANAVLDSTPSTTGFTMACWSSAPALIAVNVRWIAIGQ